ncbi:MAG: 50S ribosomal protein L9 [Candidatus Xiphinematobacter sp.]|nr:MAG: 50S ribosomal protein L9 [Candidatus Xiphinematobacter sp.]QQY09915.1 MAG: 50S ribosomal protein L9 [Candidatus Xiphinematobacter sp.]QQY10649.1 MAG: 50S ribosomal protein L9 [Candidatus Xiphinematobacter sp.]QQY11391.1 MAG: 50S ribosomal protein L9 [Candidatus Xiphinematobacter sp.]
MASTRVILTESVGSLGVEGDIVRVRRGYARNFLFPRRKALELTSSSMRQLNHLRAKRSEREAQALASAKELGESISRLRLVFELGAGKGGRVFGSVTAKDIADRILSETQSVSLPRHAVSLEKPIKGSGDYKVQVKLHHQVTVYLNIFVKGKESNTQSEIIPVSPAESFVRGDDGIPK